MQAADAGERIVHERPAGLRGGRPPGVLKRTMTVPENDEGLIIYGRSVCNGLKERVSGIDSTPIITHGVSIKIDSQIPDSGALEQRLILRLHLVRIEPEHKAFQVSRYTASQARRCEAEHRQDSYQSADIPPPDGSPGPPRRIRR